jgi:hypothetical protein
LELCAIKPAPLIYAIVTIVTFNASHLIMSQMALVDLYPELLLWIASHLQRVDLLNVSLICKHLREATQPELYRDYSTPRRRILPLVKPLIERPELRKHVPRLQLGHWTTLVCFNTPYWESQDYEKDIAFDMYRGPEPTEAEYLSLTAAARDQGVITEIHPYEHSSYRIEVARQISSTGFEPPEQWHTNAFDRELTFSELSYDRKFSQILRAGLDDPVVVLLVALLPNLKEIIPREIPSDIHISHWRTKHKFPALRRPKVRCWRDDPGP